MSGNHITGKLRSLSETRKELLNIPRDSIIRTAKCEELTFQTTLITILLRCMSLNEECVF